jgi:hypothetical protein
MGRESIYGMATASMHRKRRWEEQQLTNEREIAYRRGFDQALYFTLRYLGLEDKQVQALVWKQRVAKWRAEWSKERGGWQRPPEPTPMAVDQLRQHVSLALQDSTDPEAA